MKITNMTLHHETFGDMPVTVPFSMYQALIENHKIDDPYVGENDTKATALSETGMQVSAEFDVPLSDLAKRFQLLRLEGIDTVADVYLNGQALGCCENMHRTYEFPVRGLLKPGRNQLLFDFHSPILYIRDKQHRHYTWGQSGTLEGFPHIRKASYMFGWDWSPQLPDMGIFRSVELLCYDLDRLDDLEIRQVHTKVGGKTTVTLNASATTMHHAPGCRLHLTVTSPLGERFDTDFKDGKATLTLDDPMLWWPNHYGDQPLYTVTVSLAIGQSLLDARTLRLGLRTMEVSTDADEWGSEFCFKVNGVKVFAMGASYVPEDNLLPRINPARTRQLLESMVEANFNAVRIWGGGFYCHDDFYDSCDELGIIVWQDFMVACSNVRLSKAFKENMIEELKDNIRRLRHHACIGLFCGNNEMEEAVLRWDECKDSALAKMDYLELYERIMPDLCDELCPDIFYWPSSPCSGGGFMNPDDPNRGDVHYWGAWHGNIPFESYRQYYFRFCSEFGFESFPNMKTIRSYASEDDMNAFSPVMEAHQKCLSGNTKILTYLSDKYRYPTNFSDLVYASELLQLDAIRYGVEHFRRFRGRCMGAIFWQLNDSWPVASWSAVDYFGRWKALMYGARRFFAPVLLSAHEKGTKVTFNIANETPEAFTGHIRWRILDQDLSLYLADTAKVTVPALSSLDIATRDFAEEINGNERSRFLAYELYDEDGLLISASSLLFCRSKQFNYRKPALSATVKDGPRKGNRRQYLIEIASDCFASHVEIDFPHYDLLLSDNYFEITESDKLLIVAEIHEPDPATRAATLSDHLPTAEELQQDMTLRSVYDIGRN